MFGNGSEVAQTISRHIVGRLSNNNPSSTPVISGDIS